MESSVSQYKQSLLCLILKQQLYKGLGADNNLMCTLLSYEHEGIFKNM